MADARPAAATAWDTDNDDALAAVVNLLVVLADNKYWLGRHLSEWAVGAPSLEVGVACAAIPQGELGKARVDEALEEMLCWFGPPGEHGVDTLQGEELRQAHLDRVGPLLQGVGGELGLGRDQATGRWEGRKLPWERWNHLQRRLEPVPASA